ncbi:hypothetical protein [Nocardioides salarius]|uniref:hypothetical protein n=1 Tax=Nocardioides salarius TaxID=374513 RepID=UPI0030FA9C1F
MDRGTTPAAVGGALAALVGGALWLLAWAGPGPLAWWPGAALLALAAVALGAGLVDRGAAPLRLVVGVCLAVLCVALLAVVGGLAGAGGSASVDAVVGALTAALGALVLAREVRRRRRDDTPGGDPEPPAPGRGRPTRAARPAPGRRRTGGAHAG